MNDARCLRLIRNAVAKLDLDLTGLIVLTEAATGYYVLTPLIAALAGADQVYAITQDSSYGSAQEVCERTQSLADRWGVADQIEILFSRKDERIEFADIVTNLGFVRPLDVEFLGRLKRTAVIPLMFETWEHRPEDLDLAECRRLGIPVLGTNEEHPDLQIFRYVGHLALKLLFELDIEVYRSRIIVIGSGKFGRAVADSLTAAGASVSQLSLDDGNLLHEQQVRGALADCDAIVVAEHHSREAIIGPRDQITARKLRSINPGVVLAHIAGNVDRADIETAGIPFRPSRFAPPGYMSIATDYLGPRPLIDLHTAGLKVGETMARLRRERESSWSTELKTLNANSLAQGFAGYHDREEL